jgi:hypothetical protein
MTCWRRIGYFSVIHQPTAQTVMPRSPHGLPSGRRRRRERLHIDDDGHTNRFSEESGATDEFATATAPVKMCISYNSFRSPWYRPISRTIFPLRPCRFGLSPPRNSKYTSRNAHKTSRVQTTLQCSCYFSTDQLFIKTKQKDAIRSQIAFPLQHFDIPYLIC